MFMAISLLAGHLSAQTLDQFSLTNVVDGKTVSLSGFGSQPGMVIIFFSNACPFDLYYLDRIQQLASRYTGRMPVLLINAHNDPDETADKMKAFANLHALTIPYLADKDQTVMNKLTARRSPEAFVLKNSSGKFSVVYRGAIDDNPQAASEVTQPYVQHVVDKLLAGEKIDMPETRPAGCSLRRN
jgi:peroxiredoxin